MPCKDQLEGTCANPSCEKWHSLECALYKSAEGCKFGISAHSHTGGVRNNLAKGPREVATKVQLLCSMRRRIWGVRNNLAEGPRSCDRSAVAMLNETKNLGCVLFRTWSRQDRHRFYGRPQPRRNQSDVSDFPQQYYAKLRDQNPSLNKICLGDSPQRSPNAPLFEETVSGRDRVARSLGSRSSMEAGKENPEVKGDTWS